MGPTAEQEMWKQIKDEKTALLVTVRKDGSFDSRLLGCARKDFDGTLWFLALKDSPKALEVERNQPALVSYTRPPDGEFVSISGRARIVENPVQIHAFWSESLRDWFPDGPKSPSIRLLALDVEVAKFWTKPASSAYYYVHLGQTAAARARSSAHLARRVEIALPEADIQPCDRNVR